MTNANKRIFTRTYGVLHCLADGQFHSGEALAALMGTSRANVWKVVQRLQALDIPITARKGKGYVLAHGLDLLDPDIILANLPKKLHCELAIFPELPSTNRYVLQLIRHGIRSGYVCLSEMQHAGYGRRNDHWESPFAQNIYLSLYECLENNIASLTTLPLVAAIAVQRMLVHLGIENVQLKWPNDVLVAGRKLAGVLVEVVSNALGPCHTVIGVGLNVHMKQKKNSPWVSLAQLYAGPLQRNKLVAMQITELRHAIAQLQREGFEGFLQEWHLTDALRGHYIEVQTPQGKFKAQALGISADGALHIKANGQEDFLRGAVVRVRKQAMVAV